MTVKENATATENEGETEIPLASAEPTVSPKPKMCRVVAPQTLTEGYTFPAQVDGIDFVVTVPPGGVVAGQQFEVPYPTPGQHKVVEAPAPAAATAVTAGSTSGTSSSTDAPTGRWRNGLCDCFEVCGNGMFWNGWCCNPILAGQVMTRLNLNPCGTPGDSQHTFIILAIAWILFLILDATRISNISGPIFWIYLIIVWTITRYRYRTRYEIPPSTCDCCEGKCDDFLCAWCCACCVGIQIARHTHNEKEHPYQCCSKTGLLDTAPKIV